MCLLSQSEGTEEAASKSWESVTAFKSWESVVTEEAAFKFWELEGAGIEGGLVLGMKVEEEAVETS